MTSQQDTLKRLEKITEELNCTICNATMEDPHALFCGHTFCGQCIMTWFRTKKACPFCRVSVVRQPIHVKTLQNLVDLLRPIDTLPEKRLERSDWLELFPIDNNVTYIRDEDQDGVILRCSQCGWELDEENCCNSCGITYSIEGHINEPVEVSDTESHHGMEEDLSDFVVDDEEIAYSSDNSDDERLRAIDEVFDLQGRDSSRVIEINDDDDSDSVVYTRKRKHRIFSDEEEEEEEENSEEDSNAEDSVTYGTDDDEGVEVISDDEEEEDRPVSRFIDDYADESEEEEVIQAPKRDVIMENIMKAKEKMEKESYTVKSSSSESSSSDDSDSDAPDYENMFINNPNTTSSHNKENKVIPIETKPKEKASKKKKRKNKHKKSRQ